jgi:hypothetical protein
MQAALMQEYANQLVLLQLVGQEDMMRLSHQWKTKAELDQLEARMLSRLQSSDTVMDSSVEAHPIANDPSGERVASSCHQKNPPYDQMLVEPTYQGSTNLDTPVHHQMNQPPYQQSAHHSTIPPPGSSQQSAPGQGKVYPLTTQSANYIPPVHLGYPPSHTTCYLQTGQ